MRTFVAVILSALLCGFCLLSQYNLNSVSEKMGDMTEQIEVLVRHGDLGDARQMLEDMEQEWVDNESRLAIYIDHDLLEEIGVSIASLKGIVAAQDKNLFYSASAELKVRFIHMKDINSLSYRNFI